MKKFASLAAAALTAVLTLTPVNVFAQDKYVPGFYLKAGSEHTVKDDGTIVVEYDALSALDAPMRLNIDIYVDDESLSAWTVAPKVKCAYKNYITMESITDPTSDSGSGLPVYAYAETDAGGSITCQRHGFMKTIDPDCNTVNITLRKQTTMIDGEADSSPLIPYGKKSSDYPLASFSVLLSNETPAGSYEVYFLTQSEDYPDQHYSTIAMRGYNDGKDDEIVPRTQSIFIKVQKDIGLGDINMDGTINSTDASLALLTYSRVSTGEPSGLDAKEFSNADTDKSGAVDSNDASAILRYYAYSSTGGALSFEEFLTEEK